MGSRTAVVMPTIPKRETTALATIKRLLPQCDRIYVHLDGYASIPSWMPRKVRCFVHPQPRGPAVRFSVVPDEDYVLFVDDDLKHPSNYVKRTVKTLKRLGRRTAVAYHAAWWPPETLPLYRNRRCVGYWDAGEEDQIVTFVGSGTLAMRTSDFRKIDRLAPPQFRFEDDAWISGALARAGIRCVRPSSAKDWIRATSAGSDGLWTQATKDGFKQRDACIATALALGGWKLTR